MAVTTASPSTTSSRASERPASYTSEKNILISTHESVTHVKKRSLTSNVDADTFYCLYLFIYSSIRYILFSIEL